jgi:OTU domain-containing protein 6
MEGSIKQKEPAIDAEASSSVPDIKSMFSNARRKVKPSTVSILPPPPPPPAPKVEGERQDQKDDGWEREFQKLEKYLNDHELSIRRVDSDGSCLFSSFAVHIAGTTPDTLRNEAVDFMLSHENDFASFIDSEAYPNGFDDYCRRMRSSATWGSQLEIQALSQSRNVNVFIFQTDGKATIKMINFDDNELHNKI